MTVRQRVLGIRLLEKQHRNPHYAEKLGISVEMVSNEGLKSRKENSQKLQNKGAYVTQSVEDSRTQVNYNY